MSCLLARVWGMNVFEIYVLKSVDCDQSEFMHTIKLMLSTTSKNTSFLRYLMPSDLHDTAPVTLDGTAGGLPSLVNLNPSCVMYLHVISFIT